MSQSTWIWGLIWISVRGPGMRFWKADLVWNLKWLIICYLFIVLTQDDAYKVKIFCWQRSILVIICGLSSCTVSMHLNLKRSSLSNSATSSPFGSQASSLRKSLTALLCGQLNFNQGQLCLLPPAEGAAGGEKGRRQQQEGRGVCSWRWTTQWRLIMLSHCATIICGFALPNAWEIAFSIFSQQVLSFYVCGRCLQRCNCLDSCRLTHFTQFSGN